MLHRSAGQGWGAYIGSKEHSSHAHAYK